MTSWVLAYSKHKPQQSEFQYNQRTINVIYFGKRLTSESSKYLMINNESYITKHKRLSLSHLHVLHEVLALHVLLLLTVLPVLAPLVSSL